MERCPASIEKSKPDVRVLIIGASDFFTRKWLPSVTSSEAIKPIGLVSRRLDIDESTFGLRVYQSFTDAVLENVDFNCVYISNFGRDHYYSLMEVVKFSGSIDFIVCEKPIVLDINHLYSLRSANVRKIPIYEAYYFISHSATEMILDVARVMSKPSIELNFLIPPLPYSNKRMTERNGLVQDMLGYGIIFLQLLNPAAKIQRSEFRLDSMQGMLESNDNQYKFKFGFCNKYSNMVIVKDEKNTYKAEPFFSKSIRGDVDFYDDQIKKELFLDNQIKNFLIDCSISSIWDGVDLASKFTAERIEAIRHCRLIG